MGIQSPALRQGYLGHESEVNHFVILSCSPPRGQALPVSPRHRKTSQMIPSLHHYVLVSARTAQFLPGRTLQAIAESQHFGPCLWGPDTVCSATNPPSSLSRPVSCQVLPSPSPSASPTARRHPGLFSRTSRMLNPNVTCLLVRNRR